MPVVTNLSARRGRPGYVEVAVVGASAGAISERDASRLGLAKGVVIDDATLQEVLALAGLAEALHLANRFLMHRPRSTHEVRQRLRRYGIDDAVIDAAVDVLTEQGLLNDTRFAGMWIENRTAFSPRSPRMLELELRRKGIDRGTIDETLEGGVEGDETDLAVDAGRLRLHRYLRGDRQSFERSMAGYLGRRGFSHDAVRHAIEVLWSEQNPAAL
jgi:regulatory protein